jgi:excisionase family DNA binding protein
MRGVLSPADIKRMNRPDSENPAAAETHYASTAQVAKALGVSVTTVKRWVDDGVLPAHRTAGGHRKLLVTDVIRLARELKLPHTDLAGLVPAAPKSAIDLDVLARQFMKATEAGDTDLLRGLIRAGHRNGVPIETLADRVIAPALRYVGDGWEAGTIPVLEEHRISQACTAAIYDLNNEPGNDLGRPLALGGTPEHDHHGLPSMLAKLTLIGCGWNAVNLGTHTPMSEFQRAIEHYNPRMVWLSAMYLADPEKFLADYNQFYKDAEARGVVVAIGGRALTDELRKRMQYTSYGDTLTQLAALARSLHRPPQRPKRGRPPGSGKGTISDSTQE